jgi:hypothetical protein
LLGEQNINSLGKYTDSIQIDEAVNVFFDGDKIVRIFAKLLEHGGVTYTSGSGGVGVGDFNWVSEKT